MKVANTRSEEYMREYQRRVKAARDLLATFTQRAPYIDNVAERLVQWAERGFEGKP